MVFDAIIIGSGFGGAIAACRLAEAGYKVLVLERGRRWDKSNFPRKPEDPWLWNHDRPETENGWLDLRMFPGMAVAQGAAVGGGSLIYANISCEAPARVFESGWPAEVTYADLKRHYDTVARFMNVQRIPNNQWTARMQLMRDAAQKNGFGDRFRQLELAVTFDPNWTYEKDFAKGEEASTLRPNEHGAMQGSCVHLGNCDIGCEVYAKNTLDRNYLYAAENKYHAEIRPLQLVDKIEPLADGTYRVWFDSLENGQRLPRSETARIVIVAAGSLGSTELLLRGRDVFHTLPNVSSFLGKHWSGNGDFLTPAFYAHRDVQASWGPTIASAIDFLDGSQGGNTRVNSPSVLPWNFLPPNAQSVRQIRSLACFQFAPQGALLPPVEDRRQRLELPQLNRVTAALCPRQEQKHFLNVGGQDEQVHDLADAGAGDVSQRRQRGVVGDHVGAHQSVEAQGQGQQTAHARHAVPGYRGRQCEQGGVSARRLPAAAPTVREATHDGPWGGGHALVSSSCCSFNARAAAAAKVIATVPWAPL